MMKLIAIALYICVIAVIASLIIDERKRPM